MDKSTSSNNDALEGIRPSYSPLYLNDQFRGDSMNGADGINWASAFDSEIPTTFPTDAFPTLEQFYSPMEDWENCPDLYNPSASDSNDFNYGMSVPYPTQRLDSSSTLFSNDGALEIPVVETKTPAACNHDKIKKRSKGEISDSKSACWKSPLCPSTVKDGVKPDPSSCEGGCAPFLFDDKRQWELPITTVDSEEKEEQKPTISLSTRTKTSKRDTRVSPENSSDRKHSRRRSIGESSPEDTTVEGSKSASPKLTKGRQPHHEIERKYRESINSHLETLRKSIPSLKQEASEEADIEDLAAAAKPSKGAILAGAVAHIKHQDRERRQLERENELLKQQVKALSALVKCDDCSLMQYVIGLNLGNNARLQM